VYLGKFNFIIGPEIHFKYAKEVKNSVKFNFRYELEIEFFGGSKSLV